MYDAFFPSLPFTFQFYDLLLLVESGRSWHTGLSNFLAPPPFTVDFTHVNMRCRGGGDAVGGVGGSDGHAFARIDS